MILATTREMCAKKLGLLQEFCAKSGMKINQIKIKFMVFNGTRDDKLPLICKGMTVNVCESYTYLGTIFTLDGKVETSLKLHAENKQAHVMKFISFVSKNVNFPFWVKKLGFRCRFALVYIVWL